MKVHILSKRNFDSLMEENGIDDTNIEPMNVMIISICSPKDDDQPYIGRLSKESYFKEEHSNVKIMYFGDYGDGELENNPHVFTREQAKELYEFIKRNKDKKFAFVHCGAGISRSGAIGLFIHRNFGSMLNETFIETNRAIFPNSYILRLLNEQKELDQE